MAADKRTDSTSGGTLAPRMRADAQRNLAALLQAARDVFSEEGSDAPIRTIAERAGVGIGTIYRHFPSRPDLIAAVFREEIDACEAKADVFAAANPPFDALVLWLEEFVRVATTKRGLAKALHSGHPAFDFIPVRRKITLQPTFRRLFEAAIASDEIRSTVEPDVFLDAVATLCSSGDPSTDGQAHTIVGLMVKGLRCA